MKNKRKNLQVGDKLMTAPNSPKPHNDRYNTHRRDILNALLYGLVVVIWGTTWIAIFLQQGPVAAPVSIF